MACRVVSAGDSFRWLHDCDYQGSDIDTINNGIKSLTGCAETCFDNNNCNFFTFGPKSLICSLKKVIDASQKVNSQGSICGLIEKRILIDNSSPSLTLYGHQWQRSNDSSYFWSPKCSFSGYDIGSQPAQTIDSCVSLCQSLQEPCTHFVFDPQNQRCYFKKATGPLHVEDYSRDAIQIDCGLLTQRFTDDYYNIEFIPKSNINCEKQTTTTTAAAAT